MTLLYLLHQNGYSFSIAHCNFSLRGRESDLDQKFIKKVSSLNAIKLFIKKFNTEEYAKKTQEIERSNYWPSKRIAISLIKK